MSLDGGSGGGGSAGGNAGGGTDTGAGTGGEDVSVRGQPAVQRTQQQASDALDARVAAKRHAAEHGEDAPQKSQQQPAQGQRGADGKFLPRNASEAAAGAETVSPDDKAEKPAAAKDSHPELEKLKGEHDKISKERDSLKARDGEWTQVAEKALARIDSQKAYIERLEAALEEKGGSIDPTVLENVRLQERIRAIELAEQRAQSTAQQQAEEAREAQRSGAREALTNATKAALTKFPALLKSGPDLREYLTLVYRGGDPTALAEMFAGRATARAVPERQIAPRTLAGRGAGSGGPKLRDPRDIADKWKAALGANA